MSKPCQAEWSPGASGPLLRLAAGIAAGHASGELEWQDRALCAQVGGDLWFPDKGAPVHEVNKAKRICRECPVQAECLEYALARNEHFGFWGGLSERQRRRLKRQRQEEAA